MEKLYLSQNWKLCTDYTSKIIETSIPTSFLNDLYSNKIIDDPFFRDNENIAFLACESDCIYESEFLISKEIFNYKHCEISFQQIDTIADIYLNDFKIISTDNMFKEYNLEIKNKLVEGNNHLKIHFHSPLKYIKSMQSKNPLFGDANSKDGFSHIRKTHSMFGWDWGPSLPDMGIYKPIVLTFYNIGKINNYYFKQTHKDNRVHIQASLELDNPVDNTNVTIEILDEDNNSIINFEKKYSKNFQCRFTIENPNLWYPNNYGNQYLYTVKISSKVNNEISDEKVFTLGLREIKLITEKDQHGKSFKFNVNGIDIFAKGANYIPEDSLLSRKTHEKTNHLIKSCVESNFNMIRIWGGGHYADDYLLELCDKNGILIWHDFMFSCAQYSTSKTFLENISAEIEYNIKRIRHHASLALWCGNNEIEWGYLVWEGSPKNRKSQKEYKKLFEKKISSLAVKNDPQTSFWSSSPSSGGNFDSPNDENRGDAHDWQVWHGLKPFTNYTKYKYRFVSEFGFQSFPSIKTVKSYTLPKDRNIFSKVMEHHQKNKSANGIILYYISQNFKYPKDLESLIYISQILQAEAMKHGVEHWRRNMGRCMGTLYWQLNDCWPVASWSSIDYYGRWKALHYFAKRFYNPILLSSTIDESKVSVYLTNETKKQFDGKLHWALVNTDNDIIESGQTACSVNSFSSLKIFENGFSDMLSKENIGKTYLQYSLESEEMETIYKTVLFVPIKHFDFKNPEIQTEIFENEEYFEIALKCKSFAKYVQIDFENLDIISSDNYFDMYPGTKRTILIRKTGDYASLKLENLKENLTIKSIFDSFK